MSDLLPSSISPRGDDEPRVVGVDDDGADAVIDALSSQTSREVLAALESEPAPASTVADRCDTSLQNAQYHIQKLSDAGLVEERGSTYSEKGREMTVYAPTDGPVVLLAGTEESEGLERALAQLLGAVAVLGLTSLVVERLVPEGGPSGGVRIATDAASSGGPSPGLLFFLGGLLVLCLAVGWAAVRR